MTGVAFVNLTLSHLGHEALAAWPESGSGTTAGRTVAKHLDTVRQTLLRDHRWHFAGKRTKLTTEATAPAFGWTNAYALPSDCLRVRTANGREAGTGEANWTIEARQILTNDTDVELVYTADITDFTLWPASFCDACSLLLAAAICEALVPGAERKSMLFQQAEESIRKARGADHGEARPRVIMPWVDDKDGNFSPVILQ